MAYPRPWRERRLEIHAGRVLAGAWRGMQMSFEAVCARLPSACPLCLDSTAGGAVCEACRVDLTASRRGKCCDRCGLALQGLPACPDCEVLQAAFEKVVAAFDYAFPGDLLLQQFKQQHRFQLGRTLAMLMAQSLQAVLPTWWEQAWLVPVPASRPALIKRGFNPAAELARALRLRLGGCVRTDILLRRRDYPEARVQKTLTRRARLLVPDQAFECRVSLEGARIVLVDDIMTTGATLHGAAQVLRRAGAASVWGMVAARTPYHGR